MKKHLRTFTFVLAAALLLVVVAPRSATAQDAPPPAPPNGTPPAPAGAEPAAEVKKVPLSFNNAPLQQIAKFLTDQLKKPVIVDSGLQQTKVTLVNPEPLPLNEALYVLRAALHESGVALEERERTLHLVPLAQIIHRQIPVIGPDDDLHSVDPPNRIVRKIYDVRNYDPARLAEVLKPLLPTYGHITADATSGKLIIVATAEDLLSVSRVIDQLERSEVSGRELREFKLEHADVYEVVPMLQQLISGYLGVEVKAATTSSGGGGGGAPGAPSNNPPGGSTPGGRATPGAGEVGVLAIEAAKKPVMLIPDPRRQAIFVEAEPHVLAQIEVWLKHLDQAKPKETQTEIVEVRYGDAEDLASQLTTMLNSIPDESLRSALRIYPFPTSRRLMLVGSEQNREIVKQWLKEIDTADSGVRVTEQFDLQYADAQEIAKNIEEIFGEDASNMFRYYYSYRSGQQESDRTKVTVTANTRNNSITVLASPEKMARIAEQIKLWDQPFSGDEAAPKIYHLQYADPEKTKELLESLFTKKEQASRAWWWDDESQSQASPVGPLFGQFRFEAYPEMGKLIVVSKNEENYRVIDELIAKLDSPQIAGLPRIIELKFADAETLAEQLNALLNAPGTPTRILRRGSVGSFKELTDDGSPYASQNQQPRQQQQQQQGEDELQMMEFWWQQTAPELKEKPPSNLVGKLRIVPNVEQNLLMVAAPEEYADAIENFVRELDKPGYQVLIKAVIAEIELDDSTSLGFRFSTDPSVFTSGDTLITDNALRGLLTYGFEDTFGRQNTVTLNVDMNSLLSLLHRVTDLKIKSEPKILTADNVEGEFFDGQDIPFIDNVLTTQEGNANQSFSYFPVGITLRVRPHITQEANIDLTIKLRVSSVIPGRTLFGGAVVDRRETTTRVVLENGRTFMISGILREEERKIERRLPGLGDIPVLGEVFKHRELAHVNTELIIMLTPYVIGPSSKEVIEDEPLRRLQQYMDPELGAGPGNAPTAPADEHVQARAAAD